MSAPLPPVTAVSSFADRPNHPDRLAPDALRESAEWLLAHNDDTVVLVANLLRQIRQNDDQQNAIRKGYEFSHRRQQDDLDRLQHEANGYREALRVVKRATRNIRVGPA